MISPSYDKRPVYLNRFGLPLRQGSQLRYYVIGTNTTKTVYTDTACTVPAAWPQIINAESRTDTQIFIGSGDATVISYEINEGVDPLASTFPDDYTMDNQWDEPGLASVSAGTSTSVVQLGTIAALRANNPTGSSTNEYEVQGYYTQGDKPPVRYYWDASSVSADNGGTIIQATGISPGRYRLKMEGPVYDVRNSGIMPGKTDLSVNGLMSAMLASLTYGQPTPTSIYFPPGVYRVDPGSITWTSPVILDQWATFSVASAGTFTMEFAAPWDIKANFALQNSGSTGTFIPVFSYADKSLEVNLRWWGAASSGSYTVGEGDALRAASTNVSAVHKIIIDEPYLIDATLGGSFTCSNPVVFRHSGVLKNGQLGHIVTLSNIYNERADSEPCLDFSGSGSIRVNSGYPIRSSWFGREASFDSAQGLVQLNLTSQRGTQVLMDRDFYITNVSTSFTDTSFQHLVFEPAGGVLHVDGTDSVIHIPYITYTEKRVFEADPAAIAVDSGVVTPMMWYDRDQNADEAFRACLWAVLHGRYDVTMDLAGHSWAVTNQVQSASSYNKSRTIKNGTVSSSMAYPVIDLASGQTFRLSTEKVTYNGKSPWIKAEVGSSIVNIYVKDSALGSTGSTVIQQGGAIYNVFAARSQISGLYAITGSISTLHMSDCYVTANISVQAASIKIRGCEANNYGNDITNWYLRSPATSVSGNEFNGVNLGLMPYTAYSTNIITANISGNTFNILNDTYGLALVYANADVPNTILNGFTCTGNTWYCANLPSGGIIRTIVAVTTGAGSFNPGGYYHQCKVSSNSGIEANTPQGNSRIIVPGTVCTGTWTAWSGGIPGPITVALPPAAFTIPGASTEAYGVANGMVTSGGTKYMALDCVPGAADGYMTIRLSGEVQSGAGSNYGVVAANYTLFGIGG